jgi:hypothetical protein
MQYLYKDLGLLHSGAAVTIQLKAQANVRLMTNHDYTKFKTGAAYKYYGGLATKSPTVLRVPTQDRWVVVIDLGGRSGRISASVTVA